MKKFVVGWRMPNGETNIALTETDSSLEEIKQVVRDDFIGANPILILLQGGKK